MFLSTLIHIFELDYSSIECQEEMWTNLFYVWNEVNIFFFEGTKSFWLQ